MPHATVPPHPFGTVPQLSPAGQFVAGVQPHTLAVPPPPQVCGAVQAPPQATVPPHPLGTVPQLSPAGQVVMGVQPHTLGVPPPPQVCGAVQAPPHATVPLQPLEMVPQLSPAGHEVRGWHASVPASAVAEHKVDVIPGFVTQGDTPVAAPTVSSLKVSAPTLSSACTRTHPGAPVPATNAPVVSFSVEQAVPLVLQVESYTMRHK